MSLPCPLLPEYVVVQIAIATFSIVLVIAGLLERTASRLDVVYRSILLQYSMPSLKVPFYISSIALVLSFMLIVTAEPIVKWGCLFCFFTYFPSIATATLGILEGIREVSY